NQTNAAGGINGYKVAVEYRDSRGDSARGLAALRELEKDGVLVIVGQNIANSALPAGDDMFSAKKLPVVGGQPYTPEFDTHPMYFPVSAGYYSGVYGQVALARDMGSKYFRNLFCTEVAACGQSVPVTNAAAQREGMKGDSQGASAVASDYTANCLDAKQKGVDFLQSNGTNFANLIRDCARQNYHPNYSSGGFANQSVIDAGKGENVGGQLYDFGIFYDGPEVARFRKALATTDLTVGGSNPAGQESVYDWVSWEMAGAAIKKLTQANPTRADFLNALYTIKGETLGGQVAPADYTTQKNGTHAYNDCWTEATVKDGKWYHIDKNGQIVNKLTFICGTGHYPVQNVG
ncbi:MAG: ABC transporter substrate-binding protein, partial [Acidobacteria bacterium]|nr:ABC transporter substrate-binding protein [Acidobacteriota bacterium]